MSQISEEQFQEMTEELVTSISKSPLMFHTAINPQLPEYGCKNYVGDILNFWTYLAERKKHEEDEYKAKMKKRMSNYEYNLWIKELDENKPKWKLLYEGVLLTQARLKLSDKEKPKKVIIPREQIRR